MSEDSPASAGQGRKKLELLTDQQAAERMGWNALKVQRLRLAGKLPYYPGRPPLIDAADLAALLVPRVQVVESEEAARARVAKEANDALIRRVRISWLRYRFRENRKIEEHNKKVHAASEVALRAALADDET